MRTQLQLPDPALCWEGGALRPWRLGDADRLVAAWTDELITRWNPVPAAPTIELAERWISGCDARLEAGRSLDLCIVAPDNGAPATVTGEIGFSSFDRERGGALIGYWMLPSGRGRGITSAAVDAASAWALRPSDDGGLGLRLLVARCGSANLASQAVARRAGFQQGGDDGHGHQLWIRRSRA